MYAREPVGSYLSIAQQRLKADSRFLSPFEFRIKYSQIADRWREHFSESFFLRAFDRGTLIGGDALSDFNDVVRGYFDVSELPTDPQPQQGRGRGLLARLFGRRTPPEQSTIKKNKTLSAESIIVLQEMQRVIETRGQLGGPESTRLVQALDGLEVELEGRLTKPVLRPEFREVILRNNAPELDRLAGDYGLDLRLEQGACLPAEEGAELPISDLLQEFDPLLVQEIRERLRHKIAP